MKKFLRFSAILNTALPACRALLVAATPAWIRAWQPRDITQPAIAATSCRSRNGISHCFCGLLNVSLAVSSISLRVERVQAELPRRQRGSSGWLRNEAVTENSLPANRLQSDLWPIKTFGALAFAVPFGLNSRKTPVVPTDQSVPLGVTVIPCRRQKSIKRNHEGACQS